MSDASAPLEARMINKCRRFPPVGWRLRVNGEMTNPSASTARDEQFKIRELDRRAATISESWLGGLNRNVTLL